MKQKVLVIGAGGREHALAKAFARSEQVSEVFVAPGNPGMELADTNIRCIAIAADDFPALRQFAIEEQVAFTFVGPEVPLSEGIVDDFRAHQLAIVGPTQQAAQLESSKNFAKEQMAKAGVPTASYQTFTANQFQEASEYVARQSVPIVLKQDGLAAGKGVVIASTHEEAQATLYVMLVEQQSNVVIESFLTGEEFSFFSLVNGTHIIPIGFARDYKRAYDHDEGLNTGGMGAFAPLAWVEESLEQTVINSIVRPLAQQMVDDGIPYTGVLYTGLMQTETGPQVIEFNARFGDPETQILLPLLETDLFEIVNAHLNKTHLVVAHRQDVSLGVVLAAQGYPQAHQKGMAIHLPEGFPVEQVCFAGVGHNDSNELIATGGRILMVTTQQATVEACRQEVYQLLNQLEVPHTFYRKDIGIIQGGMKS